MASPVGSQYTFFEPDGTRVNLALTTDGSNLPVPLAGAVNIEVFTTSPGGLAPGYQGSAFAPAPLSPTLRYSASLLCRCLPAITRWRAGLLLRWGAAIRA